MMRKAIGLLAIMIVLSSCGAAVKYSAIQPGRSTGSTDMEIAVYGLDDFPPDNYTVLGLITIDDTMFTVNCGYDKVISIAVEKAREVGGDAVRILDIDEPDIISTCYRISAEIIMFND
ncbi:MAG: hypothetical protein GY839_03255 [candidate division Zixibacteria bacterium]|nr:hypothetical protein [candidate division Zixibacteria bacterium]